MPGDEIESIRFRQMVRPLKTAFSTALGHKNNMQSVIVEARLNDGSKGRGECATSFVLPHETPERIKRILGEEGPRLRGKKAGDFPGTVSALREKYPSCPMTVSGLEIALFRAWLAHTGRPESLWFGGALSRIETDITIPHTTDENILRPWVGRAARKGFTLYKVKVSGIEADDKRMIASVTSILDGAQIEYRLRLDGNQGFSESTCLTFADYVIKKRYPVELFEQPLKKDDHRGLREVTKRSPIPIILDETVFTARDMELAAGERLGHGVNIKTAKSGLGESMAILGLAKKHGLKVMAGCMTESMTGLSAGINLAMGTGAFDYIDLDSIHFLNHRRQYGELALEGAGYVIGDG